MSQENRRHTRYSIPEGEVTRLQVKPQGVMSIFSGWSDATVRDMSSAGMLVMTEKRMTIGDGVTVRMELKDGSALSFNGEVVNASTDHSSGKKKLGISIFEPGSGSTEQAFLTGLSDRFLPSI